MSRRRFWQRSRSIEQEKQSMAEISKCVRAVFFDLDETLLDDDRGMREAVARTCATLGKRYPQIKPSQLEATYLRVSEEWWTRSRSVPRSSGRDTSAGKDIRLEVWSKALATYGLPMRNLAIEAVDLYSQERRAGYRLFPDTRDVLGALHRRFILGVITNGPPDTQLEKLRITGIRAYLDVFVVSGELGMGKPDSGIFHKALEIAQTTPREALHVGDSLASDIAGAKSAGMYTVWVNRRKIAKPQDAPTPDVEIDTLRDLVPLLTPHVL